MKKRTVLVITGTRAEYGLLLPIMRAIEKSKKLKLRVLATGMHTLKKYGYTLDGIRKDRVPLAAVVPVGEHDSMLTALSKEIRGIEAYCLRKRPDIVFVPSDRDEALAGAIVAGHLGIPLAHYSGGDTSAGVVDEAIRHSISKFSHVHFPIAPSSAKRLERLGEEAWRIHHFGTTAFDSRIPKISRAMLAKKFKLDTTMPWILFVQHPAPLDPVPPRTQIASSVEALKRMPGEKIVFYPNSDTNSVLFIRTIESLKKRNDMHLVRSIPHPTYLALMKECSFVVGNSSSGIIEAGFFGKPVIDIGSRQSDRDCGQNVMRVGYNTGEISRAVIRALTPAFRRHARAARHPYGRGDAAKKIVRTLETLSLDGKLMHKKV